MLQRQGVTLPVVFMTGHADVASSVRAMKAGAVDFLAKPVGRETLFDALQQARARNATQRAHRAEAQRHEQRLKGLTAREREVFERVVAGRLNKQIADELGISQRTVKAHRALLMERLGLVNAAELRRFAAGRGERLRSGVPFGRSQLTIWWTPCR